MQNPLSKLQVYRAAKTSAGLVEENNILQMYNSKPFEMNAVVTSAIASYKGFTLLDLLTDKMGSVARIDSDNREVQWKLFLKHDYSFPVTKTPSEIEGVGGNILGLGSSGQQFRIGFGEKCFTEGDIVIPEDEKFPIRVMNDGYSDGINYIYTFQIFDPNVSSFPNDEATIGKRFTRTRTQVAEYSDKGGSPQMSRPITLRNSLNTLRLSYTITRSAATDVMVIEMPTDDGKHSVKYWTDLANWNAMEQWKKDVAFCNLEAVYNQGINLPSIIKDSNGRAVYSGAGLQDQISPSNLFYHNGTITYSQLQEWVTQLSTQVTYYGGSCELTLVAGWGLFELITKAVLAEYKSAVPSNVLANSATFLDGKGNELEYNQPQFKTIYFINGIKLNLIRFDAFNDLTYYKKTFRNYTRKSFEGFIFNLAPVNGKSNLMKVYKRNSENISWFVPGSYSPTGAVKGASSSGKDGYDVHWLTEENIILQDPTGSARILLNT